MVSPEDKAVSLVQRKHELEILREVATGCGKRFSELYLKFGSPATLTIRLRELEDLGLVKREMEIPKNNTNKKSPASARAVVLYKATEQGKVVLQKYKELLDALKNILERKIILER